MATKKPQPSPAPIVVQPAPTPVLHDLPDLPTEDDSPVVEHPALDPNRKGGENNPLTDADALADLNGTPRPGHLETPEETDRSNAQEMAFEREALAAAPIPGTMRVAIKHLSDRAKTPTYGSVGAACFDLYAADTLAVAPGRSAVVPTDLAFEVPPGYVLMIYSRSGHGFKHGIRLANNTGVVDSDYRGHVPVCLHNDGRDVFYVHQGDRVAQAMIIPVPRVEFAVVDELSSTERGENGFGSTGR